MATEPRQDFHVTGMSCGHCIQAVTQAVQRLDADARVTIDLASGHVSIASTADRAALAVAIEDEGYGVTD